MKRWLRIGVATLAGVGITAAAWVFVSSMRPNPKSVAQTDVIVDVSDLQPGEIRKIQPHGYPFFVIRPDDGMIGAIEQLRPRVADSRTPRPRLGDASIYVFAAFGDACTLEHVPKGGEMGGPDWPGGFVDPCRGWRYDYAGRFVRSANMITNGRPTERPSLRVPAYYLRDGQLEIRMAESASRE